MGEYSIFFRKSVRKDLDCVSKKDVERIMKRIGELSENPRPPGCERLSAQERYRVRQGSSRIVYSIRDEEKTVWVVRVGHRREAYRQ